MAKKEMSFEEAMSRLDEIVRLLEQNEQPLEQTINMFEEGLALVKSCDDKLKVFEERVEAIKKKNGGEE